MHGTMFATVFITSLIFVVTEGQQPSDYRQRNNDNRNNGYPSNRNNGYPSTNTNGGNTNSGSTGYDCLEKSRNKLRGQFTENYMNAICASHNKWVHDTTQTQSPPLNINVDQMEHDLYSSLNIPVPDNMRRIYPRPRKEYRMLSDEERSRFHDAINKLKNRRTSNTNFYDDIADIHQSSVSPAAHWGPGFLGWHKQFLLTFERALQAVDPTVMIPYWDSTLDSHLGKQAANSILWSRDFMGNREGDVTTGPFARWRIPRPIEGRYYLWRGNGSLGRPINDEDFRHIIAINNFRNLTWHVDPYLEVVHGLPHFWVGGPMANIEASPFDPIFFLHHSFIDMMWETQRERVYREIGRGGYVYPSDSDREAFGVGEIQDPLSAIPEILTNAANSPHYPPRQMKPFKLINANSLNEKYTKTYYYDRRPTCSSANPQCGSKYLFCIRTTYKCAPKLEIGADCADFSSSDSCYNGDCVGGYCRARTGGSNNQYNNFFNYLHTYFQTRYYK